MARIGLGETTAANHDNSPAASAGSARAYALKPVSLDGGKSIASRPKSAYSPLWSNADRKVSGVEPTFQREVAVANVCR
jgi:hypothetical protein